MKKTTKFAWLLCGVLLLAGCQQAAVPAPAPTNAGENTSVQTAEMPASESVPPEPEAVPPGAFPDMGSLMRPAPLAMRLEGCVSETGFYTTMHNSGGQPILLYTDFETKTQQPLCRQAGCQHLAAPCTALLGDPSLPQDLLWVNESLYLLGEDAATGLYRLARVDPVTLERETVFGFDTGKTHGGVSYTDGKHLVMPYVTMEQAPGEDFLQMGDETGWVVYNTETGESGTLPDNDQPEGFSGVWGRRLVYGYGTTYLFYDLTTGEYTQEQHTYPDEYPDYPTFVDGRFYHLEQAEGGLQLHCYSLETQKTTVVAQNLPEDLSVGGVHTPYLFGYTAAAHSYDFGSYIINLDTGEAKWANGAQRNIMGEYGDNYLVTTGGFYDHYEDEYGVTQNVYHTTYGLVPKADFWDFSVSPVELGAYQG